VSAPRGSRKLATGAAVLALAAALALLPATAASAHDYLVSSDPVADSIVTTQLDTVTLTFSEAVLDFGDSTRLQVTGPDGGSAHAESACPTVADTEVSAPVTLREPGEYTVTWRIVSADGHAVSDAFSFRYAPADVAEATPDPSAAGPSCGGSSDAPAAAGPGSDSYLLVGTAVTIAVIAIVTFGIILLRRPRKEDEE